MSENRSQSLAGASDKSRVMKNTVMLYFRLILNLLVSLYTVRAILAVLGAEDYGIYNVVGGVITTFSFLSSNLAGATQRFFSVQLAQDNKECLRSVFAMSFTISLGLSLVLLVIGEIFGTWMITTQLTIPAERMTSALTVYQATIISFVLSIINSTYMACIIAHENMNVYAYVSILESVLKLAVVYMLKVIPYDNLIVYGILQCVVSFWVTFAYRQYCKRHYEEARARLLWDVNLFRSMFSYMGWNILGTLSNTLRTSGMSIVLNLFFTPLVNAAYGVSNQVNSAVTSFYTNYTTAYRPQVVKTYNSNRHAECMQLLFQSTKISYFLMLFMGLPVILQAPFILSIWLGEVPPHTVALTRLILMVALVESISQGLITLMSAQGRLKEYQLVVSGITLMTLPITWLVLALGGPPESAIVVMFGISIASLIARIVMLRWLARLPVKRYFLEVLWPIVRVTMLAVLIPAYLNSKMSQGFLGFFVVGFSCVICVSATMWGAGLSTQERKGIARILKKRFHRSTVA